MNTIRFQTAVDNSNREKFIKETLRTLPDAHAVYRWPSVEAVIAAHERQVALIELTKKNHDELRDAYALLRQYVETNWSEAEIPPAVASILRTF